MCIPNFSLLQIATQISHDKLQMWTLPNTHTHKITPWWPCTLFLVAILNADECRKIKGQSAKTKQQHWHTYDTGKPEIYFGIWHNELESSHLTNILFPVMTSERSKRHIGVTMNLQHQMFPWSEMVKIICAVRFNCVTWILLTSLEVVELWEDGCCSKHDNLETTQGTGCRWKRLTTNLFHLLQNRI